MPGAALARLSHRGALATVALLWLSAAVSAHDLVLVRQPATAVDPAETEPAGRCLAGSQIIRLSSDGAERLLTDGFLAACDPAVSFDGEQILFAGRRSADERLQIWGMDAGGGDVVRITDDPGEATSPLWVGSLFHLDDQAPTRRIAYLATGHGWADGRTGRPAAALYTADVDGGNPMRISYHLGSDLAPDVLANGRLVFAAWRPGEGDGEGARLAVMAVNNDGTDLMAFHDNHNGPPYPNSVRVGRDGRVYFIEADGRSPLGGGDLSYVTLRRPLHGRTLLASASGGAYLDPLPLADGGLLVSFRPPGRETVYGLWRIDPVTGGRLERVHGNPDFHYLDAHELAPHPRVRGGRRSWTPRRRPGYSSVSARTSPIGRLSSTSKRVAPRPCGSSRACRPPPDSRTRASVSGERTLGEARSKATARFKSRYPRACRCGSRFSTGVERCWPSRFRGPG